MYRNIHGCSELYTTFSARVRVSERWGRVVYFYPEPGLCERMVRYLRSVGHDLDSETHFIKRDKM